MPALPGRQLSTHCGRPLATNLYGSTSGTTRTWVVNLNGAEQPLGNVSSAKKAVQPFAGSSTFAIYVPSPWSVNTVLWYFGPSVSMRKSRSLGFVACQSLTAVGVSLVLTCIEPSFSRVQENWGNGRLLITAL